MRQQAHGFAIVSAIFLLVVLASLGAYMVSFSTVQNATSTQDINGAKAYQAARAGIEWATYQILRNAPASCNAAPLALGGGLAGFTVNVQCASTSYTEGAAASNVTIVQITSIASSGTPGNTNYVQRQLQAIVEK